MSLGELASFWEGLCSVPSVGYGSVVLPSLLNFCTDVFVLNRRGVEVSYLLITKSHV